MRHGLRERRHEKNAPMNINGMPPLPMEARLALIRLIDVAENWPSLVVPRAMRPARIGERPMRAI